MFDCKEEIVKSAGYGCEEEALTALKNYEQRIKRVKGQKCKDVEEQIYPFHFKLDWVHSWKQNVYAMRGFGVGIKSKFLILALCRGTETCRSGLTFRCATFLSPPIPRTA
jgi:hypothetical protein